MSGGHQTHSPINRENLVRAFFFAAFAVILYQLFLMARPFFTALLVAAMLTMIFYPFHRLILRGLRNNNLASLVSTLGVLILAVLPLIGLGWLFVREASGLLPAVSRFMEDLRSRDWPALELYLPEFMRQAAHSISQIFTRMNVDFKQVVLDHAQIIGAKVTSWGTQALRNILVTILNVMILAVALFFCFRDGDRLLKWALSLVPMQTSHKSIVSERVHQTFRAVIVGSFLTSAAQGAAAMVGFLIAGVHLPVALGIATSVASMLGASFVVTLPVAYTVMRESRGWGIFLFIWAIGVVGILDNFLKPILIGSRARMPVILIFFSIVGGIKLYGLLGFMLGPMLLASFLSFVKIYQEEYPSA